MARPGYLQSIDKMIHDQPVFLAVLASLVDGEVSLHDKDTLLSEDDWPLLQVRNQASGEADFILCNGAKAVGDLQPKLGTLSSPDYSATLIIVIESINDFNGLATETADSSSIYLTMTGPGIETEKRLILTGLDHSWLQHRTHWIANFPLGVDLILMDSSHLISIPRSTRLEVGYS